ncbi:MAG: S41 family peptidase, partial [Acidimicrobiales bacterium]
MPDAPYLRYPAIRGDLLAFVADDDVWVGSIERAEAWRLGADRARVRHPRFSPDGRWLAWTSSAAGPPEVWVAEVDGGQACRLTYWGDPTTHVVGWHADGRVLATTAVHQPYTTSTWAWAVPLDGGAPERLPYGPVSDVAHGPAGGVLLGVDRSPNGAAGWKRYRGGTAGKVWIDADGSGQFGRFAAHLDGQLEDPDWVSGRVVLLSDHEGWANVYSFAPDGSDIRRHTDHGDCYARDADSDGERVVYSATGDLWLLESLATDSTPRRLDVRLGSARRGRVSYTLDAPAAITQVAPDRSGRASALTVRGAAVWLTHRSGPARVLAPGGRVRARFATPLGDDRVVWVTDADGDDALEVAPVGGGDSRRLAGGALGQVTSLAASPDGAHVATAGDDGAVRITDAASGETRQVDRSAYDIVTGLCFSPDSRWLAWSAAGPGGESALRQLKLAQVGDGTVLAATPMRFQDAEPVFTPDGRYLAFLSRRTFDPVYDELRFDLSFSAATRPYLLRLAASTPPPLGPTAEGRPLPAALGAGAGAAAGAGAGAAGAGAGAGGAGAAAGVGAGGAGAAGAGADAGNPPEVVVDADGLVERVVELPVAVGRMEGLRATAGGLVWRSLPAEGNLGVGRADPDAQPQKAKLEHLDLVSGKVSTLAEGVDDVQVTAAGTALVIRKDDGVRVIPADRAAGEGDDSSLEVDLGRILVTVEPGDEWVQLYEEAARLLRRHYWVE